MQGFWNRLFSIDKGNRLVRDLIFIILFIWQSASYGYFDDMVRYPDGTHMWRKCDGASIALNYAQRDLSLFSPELHNLFEGSGKAVGEFPLFYYLVGKTYQVFGFSNEIFRWWWWGIMTLGFYFLFQWFYLKTKSTTVSILLNILCFTPPILVYYAIEFLPDTIALALSFCGLYFYEKWRKNKRLMGSIIGVVFFSLAILTKVSTGILLISIVMYELVGMLNKDWKKNILLLIPWSIPFVLTFIWIQYANWYNAQTNNIYFLLDIVPYWSLSAEQIEAVKTNFKLSWYDELFAYKSIWVLTLPFFAAAILWVKKLQRQASLTITYSILTSLFVLLFFERFKNHDYYIICLYAFLPLACLFVYSLLNMLIKNRVIRVMLVLLFIPYVAKNVSAAQQISQERTATWNYYNETDNDLTEIEEWLTSEGVTKEKPVLSVFDPTPNVTLYFMNRRGLTNLYHDKITEGFVQHAKNIGINYLLVHSQGFSNPKNEIKYCSDTISSFKNIHLFKLN